MIDIPVCSYLICLFLYIDGCILDNFPIHIFPNDNHTLGIRLKSSRNNNILNIEDYILTIIYTLTNKFEFIKNKGCEDRIITINIPEQITQLQFDIDDENKQLLIDVGYQQTMEYINNKDTFLYKIINNTINDDNFVTNDIGIYNRKWDKTIFDEKELKIGRAHV